MKKITIILTIVVLITTIILTSCSSIQPAKTPKQSEEIQDISAFQLSQPALAAQYENQKVRLTAKFGQTLPGFGIGGMEKYQKTHVLVTLSSEDGKTMLPYVLIPASEQLLPDLGSGDLIKVVGTPHIASGVYVYLVVMNIEKL